MPTYEMKCKKCGHTCDVIRNRDERNQPLPCKGKVDPEEVEACDGDGILERIGVEGAAATPYAWRP